MPSRGLPARPHLDHLRHEAKALRAAFLHGDPVARERVAAVLGPRAELKLTEAQRVVAREYGSTSWARLRARVLATRGFEEAVDAFLAAVVAGDRRRALDAVQAGPRIATESLHVAAALGRADDVRRLLAEDPSRASVRAGEPGDGEPLLWLCHSPFHGESPERDRGLEACARALLDAGADPNTRDSRYGVPALYAVTGVHEAPGIARLLLEAGAEPTDGESVFHAAERFHEEALELLWNFGVDLNRTGDWGNTPLYFLLRYRDVARSPKVGQGLGWLLDHGADPNVLCGREEQESSLHVAVRTGQGPTVVKLLLEHGADVHVRRGDGRTAWMLARRGGSDELVRLLEQAGAEPESLSAADLLLAACGRGDAEEAARLAVPGLVASLPAADLRLVAEAASAARFETVAACLAAGFPVDEASSYGATALHHAAIQGAAGTVRALLARGSDFRIRDPEHHSPALGWACFGADHVARPDGDYTDAVRALLEAGARLAEGDYRPEHAGVREVLDAWEAGAAS